MPLTTPQCWIYLGQIEMLTVSAVTGYVIWVLPNFIDFWQGWLLILLAKIWDYQGVKGLPGLWCPRQASCQLHPCRLLPWTLVFAGSQQEPLSLNTQCWIYFCTELMSQSQSTYVTALMFRCFLRNSCDSCSWYTQNVMIQKWFKAYNCQSSNG